MKKFNIIFTFILILGPIKLFSQSDILFAKIIKENNFTLSKEGAICQIFNIYKTPNGSYQPENFSSPSAGFITIEHIPDLAQQLYGDNTKGFNLWGVCNIYLTENGQYIFDNIYKQINILDILNIQDDNTIIFECIYSPNIAESYEARLTVNFNEEKIFWYILGLVEETYEEYSGRIKLYNIK